MRVQRPSSLEEDVPCGGGGRDEEREDSFAVGVTQDREVALKCKGRSHVGCRFRLGNCMGVRL